MLDRFWCGAMLVQMLRFQKTNRKCQGHPRQEKRRQSPALVRMELNFR